MMASSRGRDRSSPWDGRGFGRIGCLLHQAEEHAIMNRAETEDGSYASGRNRKLLAEWAAKAGENEYAEPALNPCQTTAYTFFAGDSLRRAKYGTGARAPAARPIGREDPRTRLLTRRAAFARSLCRLSGGGPMNATKPKLDIDTTRERLVALGCSHAADHLDQVLSDAVRQEIAPHAFLDFLLETVRPG